MKTNLSLYTLAALLLTSCTNADGSTDMIGSIGLTFFFFAAVFLTFVAYQAQKEKKKKEARDIVLKMYAKKEERLKEVSDEAWGLLERTFGQPDHQLALHDADIFSNQILVYGKQEVVFLDGMYYGFGDILGFTVKDEEETVGGNVVEEVSSSNMGDVIGRAFVGNMVAGKAGAIIGGTTATRRTRIVRTEAKTYHDYYIHVNVDDLETPDVVLSLRDDEEKVQEVTALLNVIIHKKSQVKRADLTRQYEEALAKLSHISDDCKDTLAQAFGQPDSTFSIDGTGLYDRQVSVYDRYGMFVYQDRQYMYFDITGYRMEEAEMVVLVGGEDPCTLRWKVGSKGETYQKAKALLDAIALRNARDKDMKRTKDGLPVVKGLTFSENLGAEGVHLYFDNEHDKALITFTEGSVAEQHIVNDFHELFASTLLGRVWAADHTRQKAIYALKTPTEQRYDVYDFGAHDENVAQPCPGFFGMPVCMGRAVIPSAEVEREAGQMPEDQIPASCWPMFTYVEERTAYITVFSDKGSTSFNYARPIEYKRKKKTCATIRPLGKYDIVADDFCKKLVFVSLLADPLVLDTRDLLDAEVIEEYDTLRPTMVKTVGVKVSTRDKEMPECVISVGYADDKIDKATEEGNKLLADRLQEAEKLKQIVGAYLQQ